ncbi:MAG: DUF6328 family protein [Pseudolysinimonas sp.]|uniref:DUF6328 family protein n=1 Tax=Pseudolysinimonas sp. TaxID=2680009 RepID=UPI0032671D9D
MVHEGETEVERLDRNWDDILQELRVTQTGTQILLGFLLTIPFQQRFSSLDAEQLGLYLVLVAVAAIATILALTPVALHRALFRHGSKPRLVPLANLLLRFALGAVGLTLSGAVVLIFDVVLGFAAALVAGSITLALVGLGWVLLPALIRRAPAAGRP